YRAVAYRLISDDSAVPAQRLAEVGDRKLPGRRRVTQRHRRRHADGLAIGKALCRDPRGGHRLVLGRKTAPGSQETLARDRNEAFVGNVVIVIEQPFELWFLAGMQLDRPCRPRDRALALGASHDILVAQCRDPPDLPGLAHTDLHTG